jgi:nucleoside-diphosphate-sugar epimerase
LILDCVEQKTQFYVDGAYDFVDVRDVADGIMKAAEKGRSGETYILSGEKLTVRRIIDLLWDLTGRRFARIYIPFSLARFAARFTPLLYVHRKINRVLPHTLWKPFGATPISAMPRRPLNSDTTRAV